jgi:hypothetical protein
MTLLINKILDKIAPLNVSLGNSYIRITLNSKIRNKLFWGYSLMNIICILLDTLRVDKYGCIPTHRCYKCY